MTQDEYKTKAQQTYAKGYTKAQLINIIGQQSWAVDEWAKGVEQKDKTIKHLRQEIQTLKAKFDEPEVKAIRNLAATLYQIFGVKKLKEDIAHLQETVDRIDRTYISR